MQKTPWMNIAPSSMSVKTLKTVTHFFFFNTYSSQGTFGTVKMFPEVQLI